MSLKTQHLYEFEEFVLDTSERQLWRGEESVPMPLKAIETLCLLVENHGKLLSKDILMETLWKDTFVEERNLTQNIFTLRKKLGENNNGRKFIETVPKLGYRFVADVRVSETTLEEIEVSLENKTTVSAEGNFTSEELADAVRSTAESLDIDRNLIEPKIKQIDSGLGSRPALSFSSIALLAIGVLSLIAFGAGIWFWRSDDSSKIRATKFDVANVNIERITNSGKAWNPAISPDGNYAAYVHREGSYKVAIRLHNLASGSVTEVVSATDAEFGSPVFSSDGNFIIYPARDGGKDASIYRVPILGGSKQKLMTGALSDVSVSKDGDWLAFIRSEDFAKSRDLFICRTDGSEQRVVKTRKEPESYHVWGISPDWSPDGKRILTAAFTRSKTKDEKTKGYLVETDVKTGTETRIKSPEFYQIDQTRWMPNGKSIVALAKTTADSPLQIWQISYPEGKAKRITNDLLEYSGLNVSSDGSFVLTNERSRTFNLSLIDAANGNITEKLTNATSILYGFNGLSWGPDGNRIAYAQTIGSVGNLWIYDVESKENRQITFEKDKSDRYPTITADGKSVIFLSNRLGSQNVWKIDIDGSNLVQLTQAGRVDSYSISTDGKWLFYDKFGFLWRKPLDGGEAIKFLARGGRSYVSADSKRIVVHYFDANEKENYQWKFGLMPIEGNTKPETLDISTNRTLGWHPNNKEIFYGKLSTNLVNIWIYSLSTKTSRKLTDFNTKKIEYLDVSPDGRKIAVSRGTYNSEVVKITGFEK